LDYCRLTYGNNSFAKTIDNITYCDCSAGYVWNTNQTGCVKVEQNPPSPVLDTPIITQETKFQKPKTAKSEETRVQNNIVKETSSAQENILIPLISKEVNIPEAKFEMKRILREPLLQQEFIVKILNSVKGFFLKTFRSVGK
jgi:hypothetical protein